MKQTACNNRISKSIQWFTNPKFISYITLILYVTMHNKLNFCKFLFDIINFIVLNKS